MNALPIIITLPAWGLVPDAGGLVPSTSAAFHVREAPRVADARPGDADLQQRIMERLKSHDALGKRPIEVDVRQGHVTLRGRVRSAFEKTHASFLAIVPGVTDIDNQLEVEDSRR
ncbi:MAG TPA: BON domain-containing protein [Nitrospira sp.]|nr:BON domain-containing protein [Nitrospira sp.]